MPGYYINPLLTLLGFGYNLISLMDSGGATFIYVKFPGITESLENKVFIGRLKKDITI